MHLKIKSLDGKKKRVCNTKLKPKTLKKDRENQILQGESGKNPNPERESNLIVRK